MANQVITIPGVGPVEFPDTMSDADIQTAAKKLYSDHVASLGVPQDVFHKTLGENVSGIAAGAGERVKDMVTGFVPGIMQAVHDPMGAITGAGKYAITEPYRIGKQLGEGTPEAVGKSLVDTAAYIPGVLGMGRAVVKGAPYVPKVVGAAARKVPQGAVTAASTLAGMYTHGLPGAMEGAVGGGVLDQLVQRAKKLGLPAEEAAPAAPAAAAPVAPPAAPLTPTTTPTEALAASHAQRVAKLTADNANPNLSLPSSSTFPSPMWGAINDGGGALRQEGLPSEMAQQLMDRQAREADALTNMPRHMRDANLDVVRGASDVGASPTPADVAEPVPQGKGSMTEVNDILKTLQNHLDTVKPSKTPAWYEQPTASHAGDIEGKQIFKVHGGPNDGAAVTADQLETLGIEKPKRAPASLAVSHEVTKVPMGASGPLHAPGVTVRGPRMTPARADLRSQMMDRLMQHYTENSPY